MTTDQCLTIIGAGVSVIAVLASPVIALEVQKRLDDRRGIRERKMAIFRKLMTTRATQMSPAHVEALNGIEVEFYATSGPGKKVLDAWRLYVNHLNTRVGDGDALSRWVEKKNNLLIDLLYQMAQSLGYDIDKVTIENNAYHPKGFVEIEIEQHALRKAALAVFAGDRPIQATVVGKVQTTQLLSLPDEISAPQSAKPALGAPKSIVPSLSTIDAEVVTGPDKA